MYKSVFGDLSLQETPSGPIVILQGTRVVIPISARKDVVASLHDYHSTSDAMFRLAKTTLFWPTLKSDLENVYRCQIQHLAKLPPPPLHD